MDPHIYMILKIFVAVALGGIIGYERERSGHYAGIRTHIIVCMTSAFLIGTMMEYFALDSVARAAAAMMTGIGFIGAGTILSQGLKVRGLTTAASVWSSAALGIIIGFGALLEACVVAVIAVIVLEMRVFMIGPRKVE
ncbi:MgtC/SapB family protein [Candidatus Woesearchaeota archaeon]|nr:MgtC/SapB family protein [Candidatus Woesearchaeota archaeon]